MTLQVRRAHRRGRSSYGWLDSRHTFSFAQYYDPAHMGYRALRVINDDRVTGGAGFPTHPHRDMEIVSYVVTGSLEHRDSMGHGSVIRPGDVQRMSAGSGVTHSEFNHSRDEELRFLQIWILPERRGLEPSYEQRTFGDERNGVLRLVASADGRDGSITVHQDVSMYAAVLEPGKAVSHQLKDGRYGWLQVVSGTARLADVGLDEGDGAAVEGPASLELEPVTGCELLLFDLA